MNVNVLLGKTLKKVEKIQDDDSGDALEFITEDKKYRMYHKQDCCEDVYIDSIVGDLEDLVGSPIIRAEENSSNDKFSFPDSKIDESDYSENWTWTFYRFETMKGSVVIRWFGSSNGYYSESVDFIE